MKTNLVNLVLGLAFTAGTVSCQSQKNNLVFEHQGDTVTIVHIAHSAKYLLLPIQEGSKEGQVKLETGSPADTEMDIRLAIDSVEYYVPFALTQSEGGATVTIRNVAADALCWDSIKVSDTFDTTNRDKFRPLYHPVSYTHLDVYKRQGDTFAETPASKDSYETTDLGRAIEKADYKMGEDGGVIAFIVANKDKNIQLQFIGDRTYKTAMQPNDRKAIAELTELARILSGMEQIRKDKKEANLKIEFVTRKMQEQEEEK